ncbi:gp7 [Klebsiella pneumoniae subsp. ozaenae]|uniref:Gp7 n=1 Tax=Klebsiella pneumoniae subsp. ozaenae TaxID=574 RepID=A0A378AN66_KLEPO|nr:gp7 [Klebsiella pneumoniae subsp. ozaenae]
MKRNRVNVLTVVNSASNITTETIDGKPHIVVRGITPVVDDIVMNRKLYPAAEIEKAYNTLERNPMPLGHPKVDGKHVSARDVRAVNEYHVGAWLQNVSHEGGKVTGDMYVNRQYAESSEKGKRLINRLDEMIAGTNSEPIHISTGLLYSGIAANGESKGKKYNEIATNMMFDHVAVLLDEPGAGTPAEGVGIFVNAEGDELEIEVVNLADADVPDPQDASFKTFFNQLKAFFSANSDSTQKETDPMKELIVNALKANGKEVEGKTDAELMDAYNQMKAEEVTAKKKDDEEIDPTTGAPKKTEQAANNEEMPAWAKALTDQVLALNSKINANSESEKSNMRAAVKAKFGMTDIAVNALDGEPPERAVCSMPDLYRPEWCFPPGYQYPISQRNAGVKNG